MSRTSELQLNVNTSRVVAELHQLAEISDCSDPSPAVTRVVFTEKDLQAREYLKSLYESAGLQVRVDAVGNTFARWTGTSPELPVVGTGSHTDAIPFSGMYDGTVGVLGGLEAIRALKESGFQPERSIELLMITSEEPTRFGVGCTGSRVMAGVLDEKQLDQLVDAAGDSYNVVRTRAGFSGTIASAAIEDDYYHSWIELHIEQGPELEDHRLPIGIVTAIAAPSTMTVELTGEGGHAGGVLMPRRKDALCAASEIIHQIESLAIASPSEDLVATVGELDVHPGAVNSIPSRVRFTIDLRDINGASRDEVKSQIESMIEDVSSKRGIQSELKTLNSDPPATASAMIIQAAENACQAIQVPHQKMISRAYHDSLFIAQVAPMGMLFIPCRKGISHRPDEYSSPEEIQCGIEVLARTLASLSTQ